MFLSQVDPVWAYRIVELSATGAVLTLVILLLRLFKDAREAMADLYFVTGAAAEEVGKGRLLDHLDQLAESNRSLRAAVRQLTEQREERQKAYREFLQWQESRGQRQTRAPTDRRPP